MLDNIDQKTVEGFGEEWKRYDQRSLSDEELNQLFTRYFSIFPWEVLAPDAVGFDLGCGSGRWAKCVAPKIGQLHCIDASEKALAIAKENLSGESNCIFHLASVENIPLPLDSADFGYSLGVLHHVPDTLAGIKECVKRLKPGAPFLIYLYYAFDNRPAWFRYIWQLSDWLRQRVSKLPFEARHLVCQLIAAIIYFPLARLALVAEKLGGESFANMPLYSYRHSSFYTMKTDALDRFGTRLEQRFTAAQIMIMMEGAGLERIIFSDKIPYWCAVGYKQLSGKA